MAYNLLGNISRKMDLNLRTPKEAFQMGEADRKREAYKKVAGAMSKVSAKYKNMSRPQLEDKLASLKSQRDSLIQRADAAEGAELASEERREKISEGASKLGEAITTPVATLVAKVKAKKASAEEQARFDKLVADGVVEALPEAEKSMEGYVPLFGQDLSKTQGTGNRTPNGVGLFDPALSQSGAR